MKTAFTAAVVTVSGAALFASLWVTWTLGPPASVPGYLLVNVLLVILPACVARLLRHRQSAIGMLLLVGVTILSLTLPYGLHCRFLLSRPPDSLIRLLVVLATGLLWVGSAAVLVLVVLRQPGASRSTRRVMLVTTALPAGVLAVHHLVLILLVLAVVVVSEWTLLAIALPPAIFALLELTGNTVTIAAIRRCASTPVAALDRAVVELRANTNPPPVDVLFLDRDFPAICEVRQGLGGAALIVSAKAIERLSDDETRAVVAHEWAHLCLSHLRERMVWSAALWVGGLVVIVLAAMYLPASRSVAGVGAGVAAAIFATAAARHLCLTVVLRRHERVADQFAAGWAGPDVLERALKTTIEDSRMGQMFGAFSTHDSLAQRVAAARTDRGGSAVT